MLVNTSIYLFKALPNSFLRCKHNIYIYVIYVALNYKIYFYTDAITKRCDNLNKIVWWNAFTLTKSHSLLVKLFLITWTRLIFKGKGFRVRVFRGSKKLTFNFGHSHWTRLLCLESWDFFKLRRQNYLFFTNHQSKYYLLYLVLSRVKKANKYTLRGLRFKKQPLTRRFGKISQYISSLH